MPNGDRTPLEMTNVILTAPSGVVKGEITVKSPFQSPLDLCCDSEPSACEHSGCCSRDHCLFSCRDIIGHSNDKLISGWRAGGRGGAAQASGEQAAGQGPQCFPLCPAIRTFGEVCSCDQSLALHKMRISAEELLVSQAERACNGELEDPS